MNIKIIPYKNNKMKKKVGQEVEDLMMHVKFMKGLKEDKAIAK